MGQRDPRIDPQPGDVVKDAHGWVAVLGRMPESLGGNVRYVTSTGSVEGVDSAEWAFWFRVGEVVAVEGFSVDPDTFDALVSE